MELIRTGCPPSIMQSLFPIAAPIPVVSGVTSRETGVVLPTPPALSGEVSCKVIEAVTAQQICENVYMWSTSIRYSLWQQPQSPHRHL